MAKSKKTQKRFSANSSQYQASDEILGIFESAEQYFASGNYANAKEIYRRILSSDKRFTPALRQLALSELHMNETESGIKHLSKYLKSAPEDQQAYAYLAQAHLRVGQPTKARHNIALALKLGETADLHFLAAAIEEQLNVPHKAITHYEHGLVLDPNRTSARLAFGVVQKNLCNYHLAISSFQTILDSEPEHQNALSNLGTVFHAIGLYELAIECYTKAQTSTPNADIAYNLGLSYQQLSDPTNSVLAFEQALSLAPDHIEAKIQIAETLSTQGLFKEAGDTLDEVISATGNYAKVLYLKTQYRKFTRENTYEEIQLAALSKRVKSADEISLAHFGLAKIYDDTQRYQLAFDHLLIANNQKSKMLKAEADQQLKELTEPLIAFDPEMLKEQVAKTNHPCPIFIIGMPRAGTTLLERLLCTSPDIASCGEANYFGPALFRRAKQLGEFAESENVNTLTPNDLTQLRENYLSRIATLAGQAPLFVDKTPENFRYAQMLHVMFPNAKFIHCQRNPMDTCLSIYFQLFQNIPYSYQLKNIASYFLKHRTIVTQQRELFRDSAQDKWLDITYEQTVTNAGETAAKISDFLGYRITPIAMKKNASDGTINTMSKWQARQDIYQGSINRWRHYEDNLAELKTALSTVL